MNLSFSRFPISSSIVLRNRLIPVRSFSPGAKRARLQVKKGDRVLFSSYAGETFKLGDQELLLMREEDILAVIE